MVQKSLYKTWPEPSTARLSLIPCRWESIKQCHRSQTAWTKGTVRGVLATWLFWILVWVSSRRYVVTFWVLDLSNRLFCLQCVRHTNCSYEGAPQASQHRNPGFVPGGDVWIRQSIVAENRTPSTECKFSSFPGAATSTGHRSSLRGPSYNRPSWLRGNCAKSAACAVCRLGAIRFFGVGSC